MARFGIVVALIMIAGCMPVGNTGHGVVPVQPAALPPGGGLALLAADLGQAFPGGGAGLVATSDTCAKGSTAVLHMVVPEMVMFDTASDQLSPGANTVLSFLASAIRRDSPGAEISVLGHTDAVGGDDYNIDLSRRRAETVLRGLVARGLSAGQLSSVAIGKRQPIADDSTPEGRALNRRVEILAAPCLAANLAIVAQGPATLPDDAAAQRPIEVLRLQPVGADDYALRPVASVALNSFADAVAVGHPTPGPAPRMPRSTQPPSLASPAAAGGRSPAPAYIPRTPTPGAERNTLGPAISY